MDARKFIELLNRFGEGTYDLPTEAQWEYAAMAGSATAFYNGGITEVDYDDPNLNVIAWYGYNSGAKLHLAAQKKPNAWGLYDMSGNVWEWCQDWYSSSYYSFYPDGWWVDPIGPYTGVSRVVRGGGWMEFARGCRSAKRYAFDPNSGFKDIGFRLIKSK